jgi:tetratricopeptide (TPR) repeat protein
MAAFCAVYLGFACKRRREEAALPEAVDPASTRRWFRPVMLGICLGAGLLLGGLLGSEKSIALKNIESKASIFSPEYPTNKVRIEIWKSTLSMIKDHPFIGVGAGRFRVAFPPYRSPEEVRIPGLMGAMTEVDDPHNEYLWAAAVGGIPLAAVLLAFLLLLIRASAASAKDTPSRGERILASGRAGMVVAFAVLCLFRSPLHNPAAVAALFLIAGLTVHSPMKGGKGIRRTFAKRGAPFAFGAMLVACFWIGGPKLASDWLAASVAISDKFEPEEYETLKRAADLDPSNIDIINTLGQIAGNTLMGTKADRDGRFRIEAEKRLSHVLDLHPYHPGALKTLARIRALEKDIPGALELIERYLAVRMEQARPDMVLLEILERDEQYGEAADMILDTWPSNPKPLYDRAELLFNQGKVEAAVIYADHFLQARPMDGDALFLLGKCLKALYDSGEKDAYRRMHLAYALDWIEKGDWPQAARSIRASRRYGEGDGEALVLDAIVHAAEGGGFEPPAIHEIRNRAFVGRIKELATAGKLPKKAAEWVNRWE